MPSVAKSSEAVSSEVKKYEELDKYIDSFPTHKGALIAVLHRAQELYDFLPRELQVHIAKKLSLPASKVFGVVTFYSFLKTEKPGKYPVSICLGTACFVRGAEAVLKEFENELSIKQNEISGDGMFSLDCIRCVGACGLAPVVRVGDKVYGRVKPEDVKGIVDEYLVKEEMEHVKA